MCAASDRQGRPRSRSHHGLALCPKYPALIPHPLPGVWYSLVMRQALKSSSSDARRLLFLVETIDDIVWEADLSGDVVYANRHWYEYVGKKPGVDLSNEWRGVMHPDDIEPAMLAWQHSLLSGDPYEVEYRLREAASGHYNWFISRAYPYRNPEGEIERWYGTCTNIDPRKQNERLLALNRSKDEFISIASHQLRTPATGVKQYLGMLLEGMFGELPDAQRDIVSRAYESNERQLRIISDLLKVAQLDAGEVLLHPVTADLNELTHYIIQDITSSFKQRSQSLEYRPLKGGALAYVDVESMRMVLENIIENASKYSPRNAKVTVSIKQAKDRIEIRVADEGVGIKTADRYRLFERFSRIENPLSTEVGGTGLGLYWSKRVVDLHGGEISYSTNRPRGSIFTISLPIKTEAVKNITEKK